MPLSETLSLALKFPAPQGLLARFMDCRPVRGSDAWAQRVFGELKNYLVLVHLVRLRESEKAKELKIQFSPPDDVDKMWEQFIGCHNTRAYKAFCQEFFGDCIDRQVGGQSSSCDQLQVLAEQVGIVLDRAIWPPLTRGDDGA
jgi:hypothetical protein